MICCADVLQAKVLQAKRPAARRLAQETLAKKAFASLTLLVTVGLMPALAQAPRTFPGTALRGDMVVTNPPEILLNGRESRLAPGARIRGANNMMQLSGTLVGQKLVVNYTLDSMGQPLDVWILRPDEAAKRPWPRNQEQLSTWFFDAAAQNWTRTMPTGNP